MTTELANQIISISNHINRLYGEEYAEKYEYAIDNIKKNNANIDTIKIINDLFDLMMNNDSNLIHISNLKIQLDKQVTDNYAKDIRISKLEKVNKKLGEDNKNLTNINNILETNKNKFDALVKLYECNALVNKEFKRLYKNKFNIKYGEYIPNIGNFIENPPTEEDGDYYNFWMEFNNLYPGSDNKNFGKIYKQIANNKADAIAYTAVNKLTETEFDKLIEIVYQTEYNINKKIYNEYRDWLFMFPV